VIDFEISVESILVYAIPELWWKAEQDRVGLVRFGAVFGQNCLRARLRLCSHTCGYVSSEVQCMARSSSIYSVPLLPKYDSELEMELWVLCAGGVCELCVSCATDPI
jgi:hypothetical protein